jgi:hypothetical protein
MKNYKKYTIMFLLDVLFSVLLIGSFIFLKNKLQSYISQVNLLGPAINTAETAGVLPEAGVVNSLSSLTTNATLMLNYLFPVFLIVIFILTQYFIWRMINKVKLSVFLTYSIVPFIVFIFWMNENFNLMFYILAGGEFNAWLYSILTIFFFVISYLGLVGLSKNRITWKVIQEKINFWYLLLVFLFIVYLALIATTTVFLMADSFSVVAFILLLINIFFIGWIRFLFYKRSHKHMRK